MTVDRAPADELRSIGARTGGGRALHLDSEVIPGHGQIVADPGPLPDGFVHEHIQATLPAELEKLAGIPWGTVRRVLDQRGSLLYLSVEEQRLYLTWLIDTLKNGSGAVLDLAKGLSRCLGTSIRLSFDAGRIQVTDLTDTSSFDNQAAVFSDTTTWFHSIGSFLETASDAEAKFMGHVMISALNDALGSAAGEFIDIGPVYGNKGIAETESCLLSEILTQNPGLHPETMIPAVAEILAQVLYGTERTRARPRLNRKEARLVQQISEKRELIVAELQRHLGLMGYTNILQAINQPGAIRFRKIKEYLVSPAAQ